MHRRLIQTIFRRMTDEKRSVPDVGPHWDVIGFQGNDPRTDLNRSMGVFALFQVCARRRVDTHCLHTKRRNLICFFEGGRSSRRILFITKSVFSTCTSPETPCLPRGPRCCLVTEMIFWDRAETDNH